MNRDLQQSVVNLNFGSKSVGSVQRESGPGNWRQWWGGVRWIGVDGSKAAESEPGYVAIQESNHLGIQVVIMRKQMMDSARM